MAIGRIDIFRFVCIFSRNYSNALKTRRKKTKKSTTLNYLTDRNERTPINNEVESTAVKILKGPFNYNRTRSADSLKFNYS